MEKRLEIHEPTSCLNKAGEDELLFVLLERDLAAVPAIRAWIAERIRLGLNSAYDPQITNAEAWCCAANAEAAKRSAKKAGA